MSSLRLITYNINEGDRLVKVLEWLGQTRPDIVCLQEFPLHKIDEIKGFLSEMDYGWSVGNMEDFKQVKGYTVCTLFSNQKFELVQSLVHRLERNWLDSKIWPGSMVQRALLTDLNTAGGKVIRVANVHLAVFTTNTAQKRRLVEMLQGFSRQGFSPDIICGDFNYFSWLPGDDLIGVMRGLGYKSSFSYGTPTHRFAGVEQQLDYVFFNENKVGLENKAVHKEVKLSDHWPVEVGLGV